ncbi:uncharacterized protein MELLADRAFT_106027 [Melampsora larici-populina 98AG31]|uniref:Uncharacterized protein n=1 Tax=Melampsora larici-populina (strain 98AG31 / pathotype 3-4-7) TaxID=747676 RepID=F4RK48_MELLP|nr:uncharacterized protein MELLADRAFT_106027 [Melampsora larici-populina 98AG31]EGG07246.1 hypothetical protein MELLADRAFT_106027 [Melampsora larici-populina 98AG31]
MTNAEVSASVPTYEDGDEWKLSLSKSTEEERQRQKKPRIIRASGRLTTTLDIDHGILVIIFTEIQRQIPLSSSASRKYDFRVDVAYHHRAIMPSKIQRQIPLSSSASRKYDFRVDVAYHHRAIMPSKSLMGPKHTISFRTGAILYR